MKKINIIIAIILSGFVTATAQQIRPSEVKQVMEKVANWQMDHYRDTYSGREEPHHPLDWTNGAHIDENVPLLCTVDSAIIS